jgi:alkylhydroperoxidase/carboxymuconolactone decarboxylase family protein YurZ
MITEWENKKESFEVLDVRKLSGNFLPFILKKADALKVGEGLCVIQSFEPIPLYSTLGDMGFERIVEKTSDTEYQVYFYRTRKEVGALLGGMDVPLKPTAILNLKKIDDKLADIVVGFWNLIWGEEDQAIDHKTRYLLSLANGVGAGRYRQATRELVKGYASGITVAELNELFAMFVWNQGVGTFASEIGPSSLFSAYLMIKNLEEKGRSRDEIVGELMRKYGEQNPDVGTIPGVER